MIKVEVKSKVVSITQSKDGQELGRDLMKRQGIGLE